MHPSSGRVGLIPFLFFLLLLLLSFTTNPQGEGGGGDGDGDGDGDGGSCRVCAGVDRQAARKAEKLAGAGRGQLVRPSGRRRKAAGFARNGRIRFIHPDRMSSSFCISFSPLLL
ncbi:hypothetical protein GUJ93_ZPchr0004g39786 [Zizania palustris]|uniref:Uncharacterized protein n=1 Tax=Zizania palustris TaxID=103762 RepID=A0A8J5VYQ5_ZIZPA|nr:hypothetical protein GUJ93_ZPchr0004g39786 [Zizania palustris]